MTACAYCGEYRKASEPNVLSFERMKWGGVRHSHPRYIALDLELFAEIADEKPTAADYDILKSILAAAAGLSANDRPNDLVRALAKLLPSNINERRMLITILGYAGILIDPSRPDFRQQFVPWPNRERTPWHTDDWDYPVMWWKGSCGVNWAAVEDWFPEL